MNGHGLAFEGAPFKRVADGASVKAERVGWQGTGGEGRALCGCGAMSGVLGSGAARKRWHRDHKNQVKTDAFSSTQGEGKP